MKKFTADEVERMAQSLINNAPRGMDVREKAMYFMLSDLSRRLRQEEEEMKRDPVTDPRPGDRLELLNGDSWIFCPGSGPTAACGKSTWIIMCSSKDATIVRRRESP